MSRHSLWLVWGVVSAVVLCAPRVASAQSEPVKPYVVLILDTSGSMDDPGSGAVTGFGPPSCPGTIDTKEDHAKCAIFNLANSYAEMVLALGRFRATTSTTGTCGLAGECGTTAGPCNATANGDEFQVLVPLLENNHADIAMWTDFVCSTCDPAVAGGNLEMYSSGATPLAGSLEGAQLYWQGANSPSFGAYWSGPGDDPIVDDPLNDVFVGGEQCRPYITILLTDGDETCADITQATTAATAMLTTQVQTDADPPLETYRIETKPIGFGKPPGDAEIEALARAGGNMGDGPGGANEGAYAQNEEELQLEISAIIADAIKFEQCNDADDDCDIFVDEDFPNKGMACDDGEEGICLGTGTFVCNLAETGTECIITDPGLTPTGETCDGEDDDCDGTVDEGVCTGCGPVELCNNLDDDCDMAVDEDLVRQCGTDLGICNFGTQVCTMGVWGPCNDNPSPGDFSESCNGLDDDCDGTVDGFAEDCAGNEEGPCEAGTRFCPTDGSGMFGACVGVIGPVTETCDLIDNDCDVDVDEDTGGADCSGSCGVGTTVCVDGNLECDSSSTGGPDDCNGFDEDCDMLIDEDYVSPGSCTTPQVCNGNLICDSGVEVCVGETIEPEVCNCEDDDCDTVVDDGNLCAPGSTCIDPSAPGFACQCAEPCAPGEFPCAIGEVCVDNFCLVDPCFQVDCPPEQDGDLTECVGGDCVRSCDLITCPAGFVCVGSEGQCRPDNCNTFPEYCEVTEVCVAGECVSDPCAGVSCGADEYCLGGDCFGSCAGIECPDGQRCRLGVCEADPCPDGCPGSMVCDDANGECVPDPCQGQPSCDEGEWCNPQTGDCEQDPCLGVECPGADQVCIGGTCFGVDDLVDAGVDASDGEFITPGGGGGCAAGGGAGGGAILLLLGLGLVLRGRRRGEVRS
jgi:hypothetical protein